MRTGIARRSGTALRRETALDVRLVPDVLWELTRPLIPAAELRRQGGGRARVADRAVLVAVVFVLTSGCSWRRLPGVFGVAVPTAYRRFVEWVGLDLFRRLHDQVAAHGCESSLVDWAAMIRDAAVARAGATR